MLLIQARRLGFLLVGLVLTLLLGGLTTAASAAPASPTGLSPAGSTSDHTPLLAWNRVSGAVRYEVQVSTTATYDGSNVVYSRTTTNRRASVTRPLPTGQVYWRVRGITSTNTNGAWASAALSVTPQPGPTLLAPANGGPALSQPTNPPLLRWREVPGASQYTIEVGTGSDFIGASTYRTSTTSKVVPDAKVGGTYYWHVRTQLDGTNEQTQWSPTWKYTIGSLSPVSLTSPADDPEIGLTDVALDWDPVPGAKEYQLRVDNDVSFNDPIETVTVQSTRYSPPVTYRNDQYYWQVRAVNLNGEYMDWQDLPHPQFKRHWPERPTLTYPADSVGTPVGDDLFFQWTPVAHASHYQLELGSDPNFSPNTYNTCQTDQTTYTPGSPLSPGSGVADRCMPAQGRVYYWRVLPIDAPSNVPGLYSSIRAFVYDSGRVMQVAPANGASVPVPALSWQASQDAERYHVEVKSLNGNIVAQVDTYALSWTPPSRLDPAAGPFSWTVQAVDADTQRSPKYAARTFSLAGDAATGATALTPRTAPVAGQRFPALAWEPMTGAAYYRLRMAAHGSDYQFPENESQILGARLSYPSATDWDSRFLSPGGYDWSVEAYSEKDVLLGSGPEGTFEILDVNKAGGLQVAMTGTALNTGKGCRAFLSDTTPGAARSCDGAPTTPVLDWDAVPGAGYYMVYLSRDLSFTNVVYNGVATSNSRWIPSRNHNLSSLPDNNAGQAYYWLVRPCKAANKCGPDPLSTSAPADNSFSKQSPQVQLTGPADGATAANDVRFDWTDYRTTNAATTWTATGERSQQSGQRYRIEISPKSNFSSDVYAKEVDQATFTPYDDTLPEGTLFWRVQVIDQAGNHLRWSNVRQLTKSSPLPVLTSPAAGQGVSSTPALQWDPLSFAGQYQLEVYKNNDTAFSDTNRVVTAQVTQVAYTAERPLAPSTSAYVWRVRRLDSRNRPGGWSRTGSFVVTGSAPALAYPATGGYVAHADAYFTWAAVTGAKRYRYERRVANSTGVVETADTSGTSWASEDIGDGTWEWRVTAYDTVDNVLGMTAWRSFRVDGTRPTVTSKSPSTSGYRTTNLVARLSEPVTGVSTSSMTVSLRGSATPLAATVTLDAARRTATLNPSANLRAGQYYVVRMGTSIKDDAGNSLVVPSWTVLAK